MQIEIVSDYEDDDLRFELERFRMRYSSFETLQQKISTLKCRDPDIVDDYMVWDALKRKGSMMETIVIRTFDIYNMFSQRRMELLNYLINHPLPDSIRDLAATLKRDYKNVYDDIKALEKYGLICLVRDGKSKRVITRVKSINIKFQ